MSINNNQFVIQDFENLQNVNADNMNLFYQNVDQKLSAYFPNQPLILNGAKITQSATTNVFSFTSGQIRFFDQSNVDSGGIIQMTLANIPTTTSLTINVGGTGTSPQYYIVAVLSLTGLDTYKVLTSASIANVAMTLAQINAQANPNLYVPIATISTSDNVVYTLGVDSVCAGRLQTFMPDVIDDITNGHVTIGGRLPRSTNRIYTTDSNDTAQLITYYDPLLGNAWSNDILEADGITPNQGIVGYYGYFPQYIGNISTLTRGATSLAALADTLNIYLTNATFTFNLNISKRSDGYYNGFMSGNVSFNTGSNSIDIPASAFGGTVILNSYLGGACIIDNTGTSTVACSLSSSTITISGINNTGNPTAAGFSICIVYL